MPLYEVRTYRRWVEDKDLVSFVAKIGESDLYIRTHQPLSLPAKQCLHKQRKLLQDYIRQHPAFATTLEPYAVEEDAPAIVRDMAEAGFSAGVGPMAAVAGAIAEYVGKELLKYSAEVIVENGGDIFMKTDKVRKVGMFAGESCFTGKLALEIKPSEDYWGICTSSGTVGPSLSFGRADAAVVIAHSATLADAWATRIGNMVKSAADVEKAIQFAQTIAELKGVVIIIGEKLGVWGEIKLVHCS